MKKLVFVLFGCLLFSDSFSQVDSLKAKKLQLELDFRYHFKVLDSVVMKKNLKRYYCCSASISFMEEKTDVISSTEKGYYKNLSFTLKDLFNWHEWYLRNSTLAKDEQGNVYESHK